MRKDSIIAIACVAGVILFAAGLIWFAIIENRAGQVVRETHMQNLYSAWCVMYAPNEDRKLAYDQWKALYYAHLLPQQKEQAEKPASGSNDALMGAAIGYGAAKLLK